MFSIPSSVVTVLMTWAPFLVFLSLATWQASSLRGDGRSRLSFQNVVRHGRSPAGVLSWIVGVVSPRNIARASEAQTQPNFHRSRIRPGDACQKDASAINLPRKEISSSATPMSALGQKQTLGKARLMSALPSIADILSGD